MTRHVAVYVRVSKGCQNIENQYPDLERWLAVYAPDDEVIWYKDHYRGTTTRRPGWMDLELALFERKIKTIVIWRLDRLGRGNRKTVELFDTVLALKVKLVSVTEHFDLENPGGPAPGQYPGFHSPVGGGAAIRADPGREGPSEG